VEEFERRRRLEALYAAHGNAVHAYAARRIGPASADDTVSEVFVVAWRRLEAIPEDGSLPWLLACARRVLANQRRSDRRLVALRSRLAGGVRQAGHEYEGSVGVVTEALGELRGRDREVLLLTAWEGLTPSEAAIVLGCTREAFNVRLHRARRRLEAVLARTEGQPPPTETMEAMS
jgi:RNA polymerase sigma-70 factor (ECF subfamily)